MATITGMYAPLRNLAWVLISVGGVAQANPDSALADIGARIAFGFYVQEIAIVEAAQSELLQLQQSDSRISYYRALAAWRLAQLQELQGQDAGVSLATCIKSAEESAKHDSATAEPWILVAACSVLGLRSEPAKSLFHGRRFDQALVRARTHEPANPRIALVAAWRATSDPTHFDAAASAQWVMWLEAALAAFQERSATRYPGADWGEPEALALLGVAYLHRNDVRAARDVVERALLAAPDFAQALQLQRKIQNLR